MSFAISIDDIEAAAARLKDVAVVTPLLESPYLNEIAGRRVLVKAEVLQRTGSFKFRGAWNAVTALQERDPGRGVIAYSSGNHAQGVAQAAALHGVAAVIIMPNDAPELKLANTRALGAEVILYDRPGGESRESIGDSLAEQRGLHLVRPYDDPYVMAGQGSCGLEIVEQAAKAGVDSGDVLVCCGGGGLSSGIALTLQAKAPEMRIRPVEPASSDDVCRSLIAGHRIANETQSTSICDAIVTPMPGELSFPILDALSGPGLSVSDEDALKAMAQAMLRLKLVVEPGGAVALAAALAGHDLDGDAVCCVVSGGNADPAMLKSALERFA